MCICICIGDDVLLCDEEQYCLPVGDAQKAQSPKVPTHRFPRDNVLASDTKFKASYFLKIGMPVQNCLPARFVQ